MEYFRRYILTNFETEFSLSVITTDGIFSSVIPLVFFGFLVVTGGLQGDETLARQGRETTSRKPLARTE